MKLADMHKSKGLKINSGIKPHGASSKPGSDAAPLDRREQRKLDQEKGLVPFACKLNLDLVNQVRALAEQRQVQLNDLVGELLAAGLQGGSGAAAPAAAQAAEAAEDKPKAAKPKAPKK